MAGTDTYREWAPPPAWRHAVACCWAQRVGAERRQRVIPDGHADVLFHPSGDSQVVGLYDEVALPVLPAGSEIRAIRFHPEAVASAFHLDASSLRNQTVALSDVVGDRRSRRLGTDNLALDAWITAIETDQRVLGAARLLVDHTVDDVSNALDVSPRQLRRSFLSHVGVGPKAYQRVVRLQRFVTSVEHGLTLAAASAEAGYADQAHMTRDVSRLTGLVPTALVAWRTSGAPIRD